MVREVTTGLVETTYRNCNGLEYYHHSDIIINKLYTKYLSQNYHIKSLLYINIIFMRSHVFYISSFPELFSFSGGFEHTWKKSSWSFWFSSSTTGVHGMSVSFAVLLVEVWNNTNKKFKFCRYVGFIV